MRPLRLLAPALVLMSAGCLELEHTVAIGPDGRGSQRLVLGMGEGTLAEVQRALAVTAPRGGIGIADVYDRARVEKELLAAGLTLRAHATAEAGSRRRVTLEADFADLAGLQRSPLCGSGAEWELTAGSAPGTARLTCYPQGKAAWLAGAEKAKALLAAADPIAEQFFARRREQMAGLDVTFRLQVPGKVLLWTRNLERTGEREVVARVTAERLRTPADLVRWLAPRFQVVFATDGCTLPLQGASAPAPGRAP